MSVTRREFLQKSGLVTVGAAVGLPRQAGPMARAMPMTDRGGVSGSASLRADTLAKFVDRLPIPPIAQPAGFRDDPLPHTPCYRAVMRQVAAKVHRDLEPTRFWSFGSTFPGPTFEARSGHGMLIEWVNQLPATHFLPIDHTIHGAEADVPAVRTVVHVHGAKVRPEDDGYPERWFVPGKSATYYYPNSQDAATLWYHDHTMGINRLNVYAGLMGVYLIRDEAETALKLPSGEFDVPLLICDRLLKADGQLDYPTSGDPDTPWTDDVAGDAFLINGKLFPFLPVEPRKYRFRIINGSNGRFLRLTAAGDLRLHQIATDQGLLPSPVDVARLQLGPAERADIVIDFAGRNGEEIVVENDGLPILQFRVSRVDVHDDPELPRQLRPFTALRESDAVRTRVHTLGELDDQLSRPMRMLLNGTRWHMPVTEQPQLDTTEIWSLANVTDESHPIHLHLVRFLILDRRNFDLFQFQSDGRIVFTGPALPPAASEAGWKDTVRADPGMITRLIIRFEGYPGRYMWHCHVLEHGDNEMMRPFDVVGP